MTDDRRGEADEMIARIRELYHVPAGIPKDDMWREIEARLPADQSGRVVDIAHARRRRVRAVPRPLAWAVAAAALLVLGIGIGRMTAPTVTGPALSDPVAVRAAALQLAAVEHLNRSESLLTMVRADARSGRIDPETGTWARGLLSETRLLIDARSNGDPTVGRLLEDLELVLVQIVGVTESGSLGEARTRTELELALRSLEEGEVLSRIRAALPLQLAGA